MQKKKLIVHVDSKVYAAVRQRAFELDTFRSKLVEDILADVLKINTQARSCPKKKTTA